MTVLRLAMLWTAVSVPASLFAGQLLARREESLVAELRPVPLRTAPRPTAAA